MRWGYPSSMSLWWILLVAQFLQVPVKHSMLRKCNYLCMCFISFKIEKLSSILRNRFVEQEPQDSLRYIVCARMPWPPQPKTFCFEINSYRSHRINVSLWFFFHLRLVCPSIHGFAMNVSPHSMGAAPEESRTRARTTYWEHFQAQWEDQVCNERNWNWKIWRKENAEIEHQHDWWN